jgi:2-polyprenyl-6-methoxyphenol hydroxylase-like FAD-dependent oxidoreductase
MLNGGPFRELTEAYGDLDWIVPELLEHCPHGPPDLYFDVVSQVEVPRWSTGRVVLAGDSCQCVSLLAGQGASLAVAGAYVLAEELAACEGDVPSALDRYESRLRPAIRDKQAAGRRIVNWFVPASPLRLAIRDIALRLSRWPGVAALFRRGLAAGSVLTP